MTPLFFSRDIENEADCLKARQQAQEAAKLLGLGLLVQMRLAATVFEITLHLIEKTQKARLSFSLNEALKPTALLVSVDWLPDSPPTETEGHLDEESLADFGINQALFDSAAFIITPDHNKLIQLGINLPASATPITGTALGDQLTHYSEQSAAPSLHQQNREILKALEALNRVQQQNVELNAEIESTNQGVVALYAELEDKAEQLRRADELKTHFFSNMSHEFRTPVNSILALSQILLDRIDGELTGEQTKQVSFIRQAAQDLGDLVTDLLDLIKMEAGRATLRPSVFEASALFGALRGMLRPLATNPAVSLIFEEPQNIPALHTDEAHVAQILRNFISNALKFTQQGEIRVTARLAPDPNEVIFMVADTGIGIAPEDQGRIFQEFTQIENPIQRRVKGTGLGLSLSKRLAELLGGSVGLESDLGHGSKFSLRIPLHHPSLPAPAELNPPRGDEGQTFLLIDDDEIARYVLRGYLSETDAKVVEAPNGTSGIQVAIEAQPTVIFLDLVMPDLSGYEVLQRLKANPRTAEIPVVVITSQVLEEIERQKLLAQAVAVLSKETASREAALAQLQDALQRAGERTAYPQPAH